MGSTAQQQGRSPRADSVLGHRAVGVTAWDSLLQGSPPQPTSLRAGQPACGCSLREARLKGAQRRIQLTLMNLCSPPPASTPSPNRAWARQPTEPLHRYIWTPAEPVPATVRSRHSEEQAGPKPPTTLKLEEKGANRKGKSENRSSSAAGRKTWGQEQGLAEEGRLRQWQVYF